MKDKSTLKKYLAVGIFGSGVLIYFLFTYTSILISKNTWWPPELISNKSIKIYDVKQLPSDCNSWTQQCWRDAVKNGTVKFIQTEAVGPSGHKVIFAYFKNTSTMFGVTGMWNYLPINLNDGSPSTSDISGGTASEIDWVYGTRDGLIIHEKSSNSCYEQYLNSNGTIWSNRPINCP